MKTIKITFGVSGYVSQDIEVADEVSETELEENLNSGKWVTTIQEGGALEVAASGEVLGRVVNLDNELEYDEFRSVDAQLLG